MARRGTGRKKKHQVHKVVPGASLLVQKAKDLGTKSSVRLVGQGVRSVVDVVDAPITTSTTAAKNYRKRSAEIKQGTATPPAAVVKPLQAETVKISQKYGEPYIVFKKVKLKQDEGEERSDEDANGKKSEDLKKKRKYSSITNAQDAGDGSKSGEKMKERCVTCEESKRKKDSCQGEERTDDGNDKESKDCKRRKCIIANAKDAGTALPASSQYEMKSTTVKILRQTIIDLELAVKGLSKMRKTELVDFLLVSEPSALPKIMKKKQKSEQARYCAHLRRPDRKRKRMRLHPHTNDPCISLKAADLVSSSIRCPSDITSRKRHCHRTDIFDEDSNDAHLASTVWVHGDEFDACVRRQMAIDETEWTDGVSFNIMKRAYRSVLESEHLSSASKESASGIYAEGGFGTGRGAQNCTFDTSISTDREYDGAFFPYLRNPELSAEIEGDLGKAIAIISLFLKEQCPDLYLSMRGNLHGEHAESLAVSNGLAYPRSPTQGPLRGAPAMNSSQVALRLVGCPRGSSQKYREKSSRSGSGAHVDLLDPKSPMGFATVYICFVDDCDEHHWCAFNNGERPLQYCDLLVFQRRDGGRAARIETMKVGYVCIVFHHSSEHLHGSVFPPRGQPEKLIPGVEGMKIVCYQNKFINKIAMRCSQDPTVFSRYLDAHNEMRAQLQAKGEGKDRIACCHFAAMLRVLQAYLDEQCKRTKDEKNIISSKAWNEAYYWSCMLGDITLQSQDAVERQLSWWNRWVQNI